MTVIALDSVNGHMAVGGVPLPSPLLILHLPLPSARTSAGCGSSPGEVTQTFILGLAINSPS